jgi:hypothetical protein
MNFTPIQQAGHAAGGLAPPLAWMSNARMPIRARRFLALALAATLSACAWFPSHRFAVGTPEDQVRRALGRPTAEYALPGGGHQLEYASGEFAKTTYKYELDARGLLLSGEQVLTERRFAAIRAGMTADEVRLQIGAPSVIWPLRRLRQQVWSYRYESPFCQWFMVGMGPDERVVDTAFGEDPMCTVRH